MGIKGKVKFYLSLIFIIQAYSLMALSVDLAVLPEGVDQVDIYLLMGQSNMKGRGVIPDIQMDDPLIVSMNMEDNLWYLARHPLHKAGIPDLIDASDNAGVGPGIDFAKILVSEDASTRIALIPCALGGSWINLWMPDKELYTNAIYRAQKALNDAPAGKARIKGILWLQGESDAIEARYADYESKLSTLVQSLRADLNEPELPFIACTIGTFIDSTKYPYVKEINNSLLTLPEREAFTACVDARDLKGHIGDRMHYNTESQIIIGQRYASGLLSLFNEPIQLANIFSSGCVLQRDKIGQIWGDALPNEMIRLIVNDQSHTVNADDKGHWNIEYNPEIAGGPYVISVSGTNSASVVLKDIYFGDVWLLAGQSNMVQTVGWQSEKFINYYPEFPDTGDDFEDVRFALVKETEVKDGPMDNVIMKLPWSSWHADQLADMSVVGYFFTRSLKASLEKNNQGHIPLGIIKVCKGATAAEQWISAEALDAMEEPLVSRSDKIPSSYYNGMIAPIQDYAIKGVLWYQGEANTDQISRIEQYPLVFKTLIDSWRDEWKDIEIPFYYVQLAPFRKYVDPPVEGSWALMRKAQKECLSIPHTAMACIIDGGFQGDIHPPHKDLVGDRLARIALANTYNIPVVYRGPTLKSCQLNADQLTLPFNNVADGLRTQAVDSQFDEEEVAAGYPAVSVLEDDLSGFSLCGSDGVFYRATKAEIIGADQILISNPMEVPVPVAVQYANQNYPRCNLFNSEGLPAEPFIRTDCESLTSINRSDLNQGVNLFSYGNQVSISNFTEEDVNLALFDISARLITRKDNIKCNYNFQIENPGIYFAVVFSSSQMLSVGKLLIR